MRTRAGKNAKSRIPRSTLPPDGSSAPGEPRLGSTPSGSWRGETPLGPRRTVTRVRHGARPGAVPTRTTRVVPGRRPRSHTRKPPAAPTVAEDRAPRTTRRATGGRRRPWKARLDPSVAASASPPPRWPAGRPPSGAPPGARSRATTPRTRGLGRAPPHPAAARQTSTRTGRRTMAPDAKPTPACRPTTPRRALITSGHETRRAAAGVVRHARRRAALRPRGDAARPHAAGAQPADQAPRAPARRGAVRA